MSPFIEDDHDSLLFDLADALDKKNLDIGLARQLARELHEVADDMATRDIFGEIVDLLRSNEVDDARLRLERWMHPKWETVEDCKAQYLGKPQLEGRT